MEKSLLSVAYFDAGACVGTTVVSVNNILSTLPIRKKIYAFEPFSRSASRLQKIKVTIPDMIIVQAALGFSAGKIPLYLCHSDQGHSIHRTKGNVSTVSTEIVKSIKFSDILIRLGDLYDVNILKLNIEGAEFDVIFDLYKSGLYKKLDAIIFASSKKGAYPIDLDKIKLSEKYIRRTLSKLAIFQQAGVKVIAYPDPGQFATNVPIIVGEIVKERLNK